MVQFDDFSTPLISELQQSVAKGPFPKYALLPHIPVPSSRDSLDVSTVTTAIFIQ